MKWRAHLFIGVACGAFAAFLLRFPLPDAAVFCAISAASSLLPDLDIRNSKASQAAYAVALLALLAAAYFLSFAKGGGWREFALSFIAILCVLAALDLLIRPRHRGTMHGAPFALAAAAVCYAVFGALASGAFLLGYLSHLAADATH
ncbi:MAG: metal-dependent hydrolase [Candidatus Micrarchaeota archaeon]|nr:metal-dependent hydrolase [Candidatus Micrarchaeota archaeon]